MIILSTGLAAIIAFFIMIAPITSAIGTVSSVIGTANAVETNISHLTSVQGKPLSITPVLVKHHRHASHMKKHL
jgi:hypothetical protein